METAFSKDDEKWMRMALEEGRCASDEGEVPIGAVIVCDGRVIGRGHNMTESLGDVTAHAEMIALTSAAQTLGGKYMPRAALYVTVEPCIMCAGALGWSQIGRVVYGASDDKRGYSTVAVGGRSPFHPSATVEGGLLADEASEMMRTFFAARRR